MAVSLRRGRHLPRRLALPPRCGRGAAAAAAAPSPAAAARVKALEAAVVFSHSDYAAYRSSLSSAERLGDELCTGFAHSGSSAGRNVERIFALAARAGQPCSLEAAVHGCFGSATRPARRHVLVCAGFYVLHGFAGAATGSCETDGPLGALALLRSFALRGVHASLFCDAHNGPVLRAGYEAMLSFFDRSAPEIAARLREYTRCLSDVSDGLEQLPGSDADREGAAAPAASCLCTRALEVATQLSAALNVAWGPTSPGPVDCLFAIERLGAPYRNIRGRDIGIHTEPIDCLWPLLAPADGSPLAAPLSQFVAEHGFDEDFTARMRAVAGVESSALSLAIGDGGNEVGMGRLTGIGEVASLKPDGEEFVALSVNGCYRTCDHAVLGTVSNWAGSAFELAAHLLYPPSKQANHISALGNSGHRLADLERDILAAIMAEPYYSVDGVHNDRKMSVDSMPFDPHHRELYDYLWTLAGAGDSE
eukprot:TRINITY_DN72302_c0_g1_i1.p1 TRINITY_DN72302_c0_g1~~TRINITY_DN72302_c0_g1_i1.p1  ORF type:complete len:490 (+),score=99.43 TRINITY_DN72302_c0_g1_i1:38-1471(+)